MLGNKVVLVTGAGGGIGRAIVETALREGARVVAHMGRNTAASSDPEFFASPNVLRLYGDFSNAADINTVWTDALAWTGRIDVLVNNAGIFAPSLVDNESDWEQGWNLNMQINLEAPARLCRLALKHFEVTGEGIIINMVSRSAHRGDDAEHLAYGAAKGGLLALTRGIARSFGSRGTLAYAIAPAWVRTEMAEAHIAQVGEDVITAELPMREITPPGDVAEMVVFLASGRARHATGTTVDITGADYVR